MKIKDRLLIKYEHYPIDVGSFIEKTEIPEFAEIEECELFETIKLIMNEIFTEAGDVFSFTNFAVTDCGRMILQDGKDYLYVSILIKCRFYNDPNIFIKINITPVGCSSVNGDYAFMESSKKKISRAVRKFLFHKLGQNYVDRNNAYFTNEKNEKIKEIKTKAEKEIEKVKDDYLENIIL